MRGLARVMAAGAIAMAAGACTHYSQDTPEAVLASARQMVKEGHADHLTDLIYADSKQMRTLLDQLGGLLGDLQDLALAVQKAYPKDVQKLESDAAEAAKNGNASGFLQKMVGQMGQARSKRMPPADNGDEMRQTFDNAAKELFADPYGWLERSEEKLTVRTVSDDTAAIMWDGKPAFGVGLLMKQEKGRWYVLLPTSMPGVSQAMPKTEDGWEILGDMVQVFDSTLTELTDDVKKGRCPRLDDLANKAGEKAFLPAVMVFFAYEKYMEAERPPGQARPGRRGRGGGAGASGATGSSGVSGAAPAPKLGG